VPRPLGIKVRVVLYVMAQKPSIFAASWQKTRPDVVAAIADFQRYLYLWVGMLLAHLLNLTMALSGIDPETVKYMALMEKWTWISSFACFFIRVLFRAARAVGRD
jgi:hypothetical protein